MGHGVARLKSLRFKILCFGRLQRGSGVTRTEHQEPEKLKHPQPVAAVLYEKQLLHASQPFRALS